MIGIGIHDYLGVGDKIQFSHIPENVFHFTGEKCFDINNSWIFDKNPFVERGNPTSHIEYNLDMWESSKDFPREGFKSHAERFLSFFNKLKHTNYTNPVLRHPRLYAFENSPIKKDRVVVHTTGKSERKPMSDDVLRHIEKQYKDYEIIQIGGYTDKRTYFKSALGLPLWETVELIASASIFVGVNSGMMNIANCYPRVNKKILVADNVDTFLEMQNDHVWFDHGCTYFNYSEQDLGATFSYLKI